MTSTKNWGTCACGCGVDIRPGDAFTVTDDGFYLAGHRPASDHANNLQAVGVVADSPDWGEAWHPTPAPHPAYMR